MYMRSPSSRRGSGSRSERALAAAEDAITLILGIAIVWCPRPMHNLYGIVTLSEMGPIWTFNRQARPLKSHASKSAAVGKFQSIRLNVTTPNQVLLNDGTGTLTLAPTQPAGMAPDGVVTVTRLLS